MPEIALYYPHVHPRNEAWIKQAALFWPRIQRIVPDNYPVFDTEALTRLSAEGVLTSRAPDDPTMAALGDEFVRFLAENDAALGGPYGLDDVSTLPEREGWVHDADLNPRFGWIHVAKLSPRVRHALLDSGLATARDDWLGMHPKLADVYMCALAGELSRRGGTTPVTDGELHHAGAYGWDLETVARGLLPEAQFPSRVEQEQPRNEAGVLFLTIAMRTLVPEDLAAMPVERVLRLRKRYASDFWNYRERVTSVASGLARLRDVEDLATLAEHVEIEYEKTLKQDLSDLRRALRSQRVDAADTALAIKVAAPATLLGAAATELGSAAAGAGAATAISVFSAIRGIRAQRRNALAASPATWLLRIEKEIRPPGLVRSISERVGSFLRAA
jgi:hypothetical protein